MIAVRTNTFGYRQISAAFLFGFALLICHLSQPCAQAQTPSSAGASQTCDIESMIKRFDANARRLQKIQQVETQLHQVLTSIPQPSPESVKKTCEENQTFQSRLRDLERIFPAFPTTNARANASNAELKKQLLDVEQVRDQLTKKLADQMSSPTPTNSVNGLKQEVVLPDVKPVHITLVKNRMVPIQSPFYTFRRCRLKSSITGEAFDGIEISRVHDGEPSGPAVQPGGLLDLLLKDKDPTKNYFQFLVCADSVSAFHVVVKAVAKRGFAYNWDTFNDKDILTKVDGKGGPATGYRP